MTKFTWHGPQHAQTIYSAPKDGAQPVVLFEGWLGDGTALDLPDDHPQAAVWKARNWLKPAPSATPPSPPPPSSAPAAPANTGA